MFRDDWWLPRSYGGYEFLFFVLVVNFEVDSGKGPRKSNSGCRSYLLRTQQVARFWIRCKDVHV